MYKVMQWQDRISQHLELTGNRDRLMRGLMFTARLVGLLAPSHKPAADAVALAMTDGVRLQRQFRWLMFARSFGDELGKARRAKTPAETAAGALATAQSAGLCGFLLLDQLVFVSRLGLLKLSAEDRLLLASLRCWAVSVLARLLLDLLSLARFHAQPRPQGKESLLSLPASRPLLLSLARSLSYLPSAHAYLLPSRAAHPVFLNSTALLAILIDLYISFSSSP